MESHCDWRGTVARIVQDDILHANNGQAPRTYREWRRVARKIGVTLRLHHSSSSACGILIEDLVVVRAAHDRRLCLWIAHELAEYILLSDRHPPFYYVPTLPASTERHRIARRVERELLPR